jgi:hypothetical protein
MPAKDRYHDTVVHALQKAGWNIVKEQVSQVVLNRYVLIDLQAYRSEGAILVLIEVKVFDQSVSQIANLSDALGQYLVYQTILDYIGELSPLYLAVPDTAYHGILSEIIGQSVIERYDVKLLVFNAESEEIVTWRH